MPPVPRLARTTLVTTAAAAACLLGLAVAPTVDAATSGGSRTATASSPSPPDFALDNSPDYALAVWDYEFQEPADPTRPDDTGARYWSRYLSGAYGSSSVNRVQSAAPSPYSPMQSDGREKNYVLKISDTSTTGGVAARGRSLNASPGRTYAATAYLSPQQRTAAGLYLEFVDKYGRQVGLVKQQTPVASAESYPTRPSLAVTVTGTAPLGTTTVRPLFYSSYATTGTTVVASTYAREVVPYAGYDPRLTGQVLFLSDYRLESMMYVAQRLYPGTKYGSADGATGAKPVLDQMDSSIVPDPDLRMSTLQGTVLKDGATYKMWFTGKRPGDDWSTYLTTSADGIHWDTTPQKVLANVNVGGVLRNPSTADTAKKFLMFGVEGTLNTALAPSDSVSYRTYASPDGIVWTPLSGKGILPFRDVSSVAYDPVTRQFISSTKQASGSTRQMFMSTSPDFGTWATPRRALRADAYDPAGSQVYIGGAFRYGDQMLGLPTIYTPGVDTRGINGPMTVYPASSHDSIRFSRPLNRTPLIRLGRAGDLDDGMILPFSEPVVDGDTVRLYYSGWTNGHEDPVRSARTFMVTWKKDRLASLESTYGGAGAIGTKPVVVGPGTDLVINSAPLRGAGSGSVRAEVVDAYTGAVLAPASASTAASTDSLATAIRWNGRSLVDLGLSGRLVKLRFYLDNARLYSFAIR